MDNDVSTARGQAGDRQFGPDAASILATEHWSLLGSRSLIWNEAMNRTSIFLTMAPELEPYISTGHHDDERGLAATYLLAGPRDLRPLAHVMVTTPTIVATVDAALATVIVVLVAQAVDASTATAVLAGAVTFAGVWGALMPMQRSSLAAVRASAARFPTPAGER